MVSVYCAWVKVAVTALFPLIVRVVGLLDPEASPLHPVKTQPGDGVAVNDTCEPDA